MFGHNNNSNSRGGQSGNNQVCQFFLQGRCKFGDGCRNYHPKEQGTDQTQQNRFAPLQNGVNNRNQGSNGHNQSSASTANQTFLVTVDGIKADLTTERPLWPLSAYGPGLNAPRQLLEGDLEQSFEEVRLQYYIAQAAGAIPAYVNEEQAMLNRSNERVQAILRDLEGARKYVIDGQHEHPNRRDAVITPANDFPRNSVSNTPAANPQSGGFGALSSAAHNNGSAFGKPSGLGATNSAFGAPSQLGAATSGFGRSSSVGGGASSAFGQPSTLGGGGASGFSQPSTLGQTATFGQPSQPNAFGAPSALGSQKSAFGQPSQPSPFAAAQQQTQGNSNTSFGQPLQSSPFGGAQPPAASPFAQPPAASSGGGFSQPSTLGSNLNKPSPFAPANNQQGSSAFGAPSGLGLGGQTSNSVSPFAQAQPPSQQNASPFGQQQPQQARTASPFAGGFQNAGAGLQLNKQVRRADDGTSFYLKPHPTEPHKQVKVKVWMPNGPPTAAHLDAEGPAEAYSDGSAVEEIKKTYATAMQRGTFEGSAMPELPPKREWLEWDV